MNTELVNIIKGCQKGNYTCQKKLYDSYASLMYAICLRYLKNHDDASDCLQDAFVIVYDKIKDYQTIGKDEELKKTFVGWLKRIQINVCLMFIRKQKKNYFIERFEDERFDIEDEQEEEGFFDVSPQKLFDLITKLPDGYRMVLNMYILDGYSHQEIADLLSISVGTSKSQLARAKKILKDKILIVLNESR